MSTQPPVIEDRPAWEAKYNKYISRYEATGEMEDWKYYPRPRNKQQPSGPGIDLSQSRLMFITSAGAYLPPEQEAFDAEHEIGDHSIRVIPSSTELSAIAYAHTHYDHAMVDADPQTLVPLEHLRAMVKEGVIGELSPSFVSFSGYLLDAGRLVDETLPAIVKVAKEEQVRAILLVPAWPLCTQSVGLLARGLEVEGFATTQTSWNAGRTRLSNPPRATFTKLKRGSTVGAVGDTAQQRRVLEATLALLAQDAPIEPVYLEETDEE